MTFRYPCYRRLLKYLGEADAMVELTELATRHFIAEASIAPDGYLQRESQRHNIVVNLDELSAIHGHQSRHNIVMIFESAERFLKEFRREHTQLHGQEWSGDTHSDDRLAVSLKNTKAVIDPGLIDRFQYYRLVRNWVVHEQYGTADKAVSKLNSLPELSAAHAEMFASTPGPNAPDKLSFDDFVLFSRVTKRVAELLSGAGVLPPGKWAGVTGLPTFQRFRNNPERRKNAIIGHLRTEYSMDREMAEQVLEEIWDSLA